MCFLNFIAMCRYFFVLVIMLNNLSAASSYNDDDSNSGSTCCGLRLFSRSKKQKTITNTTPKAIKSIHVSEKTKKTVTKPSTNSNTGDITFNSIRVSIASLKILVVDDNYQSLKDSPLPLDNLCETAGVNGNNITTTTYCNVADTFLEGFMKGEQFDLIVLNTTSESESSIVAIASKIREVEVSKKPLLIYVAPNNLNKSKLKTAGIDEVLAAPIDPTNFIQLLKIHFNFLK